MLIFFVFKMKDTSWWLVSENLVKFIVDLLSTEKDFAVDFWFGPFYGCDEGAWHFYNLIAN